MPVPVDGLILEDDYDAEFRYDRRPVGTMQGTDPSPGGATRVAVQDALAGAGHRLGGDAPGLDRGVPGHGRAAGRHLLVRLDEAVDCAGVVAQAAAAGVRVANLDTYRVGGEAIDPGLVLGYGNLADGQVEEAVTLLAAAAEALR